MLKKLTIAIVMSVSMVASLAQALSYAPAPECNPCVVTNYAPAPECNPCIVPAYAPAPECNPCIVR